MPGHVHAVHSLRKGGDRSGEVFFRYRQHGAVVIADLTRNTAHVESGARGVCHAVGQFGYAEAYGQHVRKSDGNLGRLYYGLRLLLALGFGRIAVGYRYVAAALRKAVGIAYFEVAGTQHLVEILALFGEVRYYAQILVFGRSLAVLVIFNAVGKRGGYAQKFKGQAVQVLLFFTFGNGRVVVLFPIIIRGDHYVDRRYRGHQNGNARARPHYAAFEFSRSHCSPPPSPSRSTAAAFSAFFLGGVCMPTLMSSRITQSAQPMPTTASMV